MWNQQKADKAFMAIGVPVLSGPGEPNEKTRFVFYGQTFGIRFMAGIIGKYTPPEKPPEPPGGGSNVVSLSKYRKKRQDAVRRAQGVVNNTYFERRKVA